MDGEVKLENIQRGAQDGSAEVRVGLEERALETVQPATEVTGLRDDRHLVLVVGNDLRELVLDVFRLDGVPTKSRKHTSRKTARTSVHDEYGYWNRCLSSVTYSSFPFLTKNRGLSGKRNRPVARIIAHSSCSPIGIR